MQNSQCFQGLREFVDNVDYVDIFRIFEDAWKRKQEKSKSGGVPKTEKNIHIFLKKKFIKNMWTMWTIIALKDLRQCLPRLPRP